MSSQSHLPIKNQLLAALPETEYQRLIPHLELVSLSLNQVLYDAGELIEHVYFFNQGMCSLITIMENGAIVEVGLVGKEGMVGLPVCWQGQFILKGKKSALNHALTSVGL